MNHPNKVSLNDILAKVKGATYTVLPDGRTTICQLSLENGYSVEGKSACVDTANFNKALGEQYSYNNAIDKIWELAAHAAAGGGTLLLLQQYRGRIEEA